MKKVDVPGNAMESQLAFQRSCLRFAGKMYRFEHLVDEWSSDDIWLKSLSVRVPMHEGGEYLITMRTTKHGSEEVAFHAGSSLWETLEGMINRMSNGSLRWKSDEYAK